VLSISKGKYEIWPKFSLDIRQNLHFETRNTYWLDGANGSGKSSLLQGIILPRLAEIKSDIYRLYLHQFSEHQNFAIKAHAAFYSPTLRLRNDKDCLDYLLNNLLTAYQKEARQSYVLVDESQYLSYIEGAIADYGLPCCLIYSQHGDRPQVSSVRCIMFEPQSVTLSTVYETA
jgi:hypothetical protein